LTLGCLHAQLQMTTYQEDADGTNLAISIFNEVYCANWKKHQELCIYPFTSAIPVLVINN